MENFWKELKKPIFALAPMANVTDAAFRRIIAKYGKPAIFWTEFVSVEGLLSRGREKLLPDLWFTPAEKPVVAQIFGGKPEQFYEVAQLCVKLGFDGIDINMGCPDRGVEKSGACAALIKNPKVAQQIILETKRGAGELPVSVKTRIGYNKNEIETWVPAILETQPAALTVHLRTRKEMSSVPAHWEVAPRIVQLRNECSPQTLILGNGDVSTLAEARTKILQSGMDGVMIGRGIFGNPWLFTEKIPTIKEKLRVCIEHTKLFEELFGEGASAHLSSSGLSGGSRIRYENLDCPIKSDNDKQRIKPFDVMKKHYKAYVNGFNGAKELRTKMMEAEMLGDIEKLVEEFLATH